MLSEMALDRYICHVSLLINSKHLVSVVERNVDAEETPREQVQQELRANTELCIS